MPYQTFHCAWCRKRFSDNVELWSIKVKTEQDFGVAKRAPFVLLYLLKAARRLVATWPDGLEATTGAHEIQFWICSQDCAKALWQAIEQEQDGFLLAQVWNPDLCV